MNTKKESFSVGVRKKPINDGPEGVRRFKLDEIPGVMRSRLGWPVASALMSRWFAQAAFQMPPGMKQGEDQYRLAKLSSRQLDETTVRMKWALGFQRVRAAMSILQRDWATPAGVALLKQRVIRQGGSSTAKTWSFGDLSKPAKVLHSSSQVNRLIFGQMSDPLDDFYGAMGEAQLNVAAAGEVISNAQGQAVISVQELGFYLRDSYEFNDGKTFLSQPLGLWGVEGVERGLIGDGDIALEDIWMREDVLELRRRKYRVSNADFRRWRSMNLRGGDFMVLSDVHRVRLPLPQKFPL